MSKDKKAEQVCTERVWRGFHNYRCSNTAKVVRDGRPFCSVHDPERRKAKQDAKDKEREHQQDIRDAHADVRKARDFAADLVETGQATAGQLLTACSQIKRARAVLEALQEKAP